MDFKSFASGAVVGGLVVTVFLARQLQNRSDDAIPLPAEVPANPDEFPISRSARAQTRDANGASATSREDAAEVAEATPTATPPAEADQSWLAAQREQLMDEPKDSSWSYYMEQAMLQFLASHSAMSQLGVDHIECRTSVCQIGIESFTESTVPDWSRVLYDMRQQPWYEFGQVGTSSAAVEGRLMIVTELQRLRSQ